MSNIVEKACVLCRKDVSLAKRVKDQKGRYYCQPCYDAALRRKSATAPSTPPKPAATAVAVEAPNPYALVEPPDDLRLPPLPAQATPGQRIAPGIADGQRCPCCEQPLPPKAKICVPCGIKIPSGRPLITAMGRDENQLYANAEGIIQLISYFFGFGLYPIASEAYATHKPIVTWIVATTCAVCSVLFYFGMWSNPQSPGLNNLMLWPNATIVMDDSPEAALAFYQQHEHDRIGSRMRLWIAINSDKPFDPKNPDKDALVDAYVHVHPRPRGEFHWYQLLTNTFLHDYSGIVHLITHLGGNMLFLLIFGTRVNALIGNVKMAVLYPILAILASGAHLLSVNADLPVPALGASGAIMGLAGMYLIFFPVHRVYMAFWLRILWRFPAWIKIWPVRGFWVLLFYLSFDVLATLLRSRDGVAHWAHLGGFIAGISLAVLLLVTRYENARNADLLSVVLGRYAWPLVGRPSQLRRPAMMVAQVQ